METCEGCASRYSWPPRNETVGFRVVGKRVVKFNNKFNSLQRYESAQNYISIHRVVQGLSKYNVKFLHRRHI
jgi:hypothetical protein